MSENIYSLTFSAVAVSAAQDLFEIVSAAAGVIKIHGFNLFQTSDHGDAAAEGLQVLFVRGHSTSGSGGSSFTPILRSSKQGAAAATCEINNTTIASSGTAVNYYADGWNVQAGTTYWWTPETRPVLRNSERGVLRITAPADALTMSGTLYFEEL
jgi:hypothetical protein